MPLELLSYGSAHHACASRSDEYLPMGHDPLKGTARSALLFRGFTLQK
ncbi:MAG: hypothetical protein KBF75_14930 [Saprospiraceae bacterium]|nr:hypothetical protein [Saprospiraceae bacterium]